MNAYPTQKSNEPHIKVYIKGRTAVISGIVEREEYKHQVGQAVQQLQGIESIQNYLCVIAPFKPLSKLLKQTPKRAKQSCENTPVTVLHYRTFLDEVGDVIYHDTLTRAQEFFRHNPGYVAFN